MNYIYMNKRRPFLLRRTLSFAGSSSEAAWIPYARKQRIAPIHSSVENPPKSCLQNFTHSGVVGGGVNAFGPSRAKTSFAREEDKPCQKLLKKILSQQVVGKSGIQEAFIKKQIMNINMRLQGDIVG